MTGWCARSCVRWQAGVKEAVSDSRHGVIEIV